MRSTLLRTFLSLGLLAGALTWSSLVAAQAPPSSSQVKSASKHFQRGVTLYNEADYRAALVEFRRAYELAPAAAVLYNLGQTHFQLQSYAAALETFERYLAEAGDRAPHRAEVEANIETLRSRVGKLALRADTDGCEILIDDEVSGRTPLDQPLTVSIGRRKVVIVCEGAAPQTKLLDVSAGEQTDASFSLARLPAAPAAPVVREAAPVRPAHPTNWGKIGWTSTAVLGAGAAATGILAYLASRDLRDAKNEYPTTAADLDSAASKVTRYSVAADVLGAATLIVGGLTLTYTLTRSSSSEVKVSVTPRGVQLSGAFR